jgi:cysteine desulfurase
MLCAIGQAYIGRPLDFAIITEPISVTERLYLDHAATTPVITSAKQAVIEALDDWANPSSPHAEGRATRGAIENARERIKASLNWDHDIVFTSGATEALEIAITRTVSGGILVGATEHDAVHRITPNAFFLPVTPEGVVARDALFGRLAALGAQTPLVVVQHANNETGIMHPIDDLIEVTHEAGGLFLCDCAQTAGKIDLPDADLIAVSGHKLGGPPGIGALLVRDLGVLMPSGGQEKGYRGGTENYPAIMGLAAALEQNRGWVERANDLRQHLDGAIEAAGGEIVGRGANRLATIAGYRMPGKASSAMLIQLDMAGISVSAGSACSSGSLKVSKVLSAMGWAEDEASEVIRVSFGPDTSRADIYRFVEAWKRIRP